jgi:hypothetical protein
VYLLASITNIGGEPQRVDEACEGEHGEVRPEHESHLQGGPV